MVEGVGQVPYSRSGYLGFLSIHAFTNGQMGTTLMPPWLRTSSSALRTSVNPGPERDRGGKGCSVRARLGVFGAEVADPADLAVDEGVGGAEAQCRGDALRSDVVGMDVSDDGGDAVSFE